MTTNDTSCLERIKYYFKLTNEFESIKTNLLWEKSSHGIRAYIIKYITSIGNKKQKKDRNFYHYACQAWLMTLFKQLQGLVQFSHLEESNSIYGHSFYDTLIVISKVKLSQTSFNENLAFILKTFKETDHILRLTELKMAQIFMTKIEKAKTETIDNQPKLQRIDLKDFENILFLIMKKAVNYMLNEMDAAEENKDSLLLLNIFTQLSKDRYKALSLSMFQKEVHKERLVNIEAGSGSHESVEDPQKKKLELQLLNPNEIFFSFAKGNLNQLLRDMERFNFNSLTIYQKIYSAIYQRYIIKILPFEITNKNLARGWSYTRDRCSKLKKWLSHSYIEGLKIIPTSLNKIVIYPKTLTLTLYKSLNDGVNDIISDLTVNTFLKSSLIKTTTCSNEFIVIEVNKGLFSPYEWTQLLLHLTQGIFMAQMKICWELKESLFNMESSR